MQRYFCLCFLKERVNHHNYLYSRFRQNHRIQEVIAKGEASNIVDVDAKSILVLHCFIVKERFGKGAKQSQV